MAEFYHTNLKDSTVGSLQGFSMDPCVLDAQSYLTFCDPMDCSLPGSSVHGISQTRILEWVAIPFFRGSSLSRD